MIYFLYLQLLSDKNIGFIGRQTMIHFLAGQGIRKPIRLGTQPKTLLVQTAVDALKIPAFYDFPRALW